MCRVIFKTVGLVCAALTTSSILFGAAAQATPGVAAAPSAQTAQQDQASDVAPLATVTYRIAIWTSDVEDAGTDSDVLLRLCGTLGCTPARYIADPNKDDRERGQIDIHFREWENVGTLTSIRLWQENNGSAWHLHSVEVKYNGTTAEFPYGRWMPQERWVVINRA